MRDLAESCRRSGSMASYASWPWAWLASPRCVKDLKRKIRAHVADFSSLPPCLHRLPHQGSGRLLIDLQSDSVRIRNVGEHRSAVGTGPRVGDHCTRLPELCDTGLGIVGVNADMGESRSLIRIWRRHFYERVLIDLEKRCTRFPIGTGKAVGFFKAHYL